jgi:hypothetical protein
VKVLLRETRASPVITSQRVSRPASAIRSLFFLRRGANLHLGVCLQDDNNSDRSLFSFTTYGSLSPSVSNNFKQLLGEAEREGRH